MHIDHFTIRSDDLAATRDFFLSVFDALEERPRPVEIQRRIPGHWLYADGKPIVHLIAGRGEQTPLHADTIDHVGIHLEDYVGFRNKLDQLDVHYSLMDLPELTERRIFFRSPEGALIETVFNEPTPTMGAQ